MLVPVRVAPSPIHGVGVFAVQKIPKGSEVWRFTPEFDQELDPEVLETLPEHIRERMLHYGYIDHQVKRLILCCDDARLINHSDTPNLRTDYDADKYGADFAIRDILPGEELTVDYREFEGDQFDIPEMASDIQPDFNVVTARAYRKGGVGAMMDEYERAAAELKALLPPIPDEHYKCIVDADTKDEDCRSIQTILRHIVRAGYGYANYIRTAWNMPVTSPESVPLEKEEALEKIDAFMKYTAETLDGKWEMTDEEIQNTQMVVRWGPTYDLEQLMEHAIVHILRHRRQIERFLIKLEVS